MITVPYTWYVTHIYLLWRSSSFPDSTELTANIPENIACFILRQVFGYIMLSFCPFNTIKMGDII